MGDIDYFDEALSLFAALPSFHTDYLTLAGRSIHLNTPSPVLRELFLFSLAHLVTEKKADDPDLTIWYAEDKDLCNRLSVPPGGPFNAQGYRPNYGETDIQIFFQPWQKQVFLYSRTKRTGIYWVSAAEDIPWWETTFSFRAIFHLWTLDLPVQLVHAGAIADEQSGVLITGPSGSGKSTSCLNLLRAGYKYLGDDYVWIELEPEPVVHALYQTAKVEADNFTERFTTWQPFLKNPGSYFNEKAILDVKKMLPGQWLPYARLKAILLPAVSGLEQTSLSRIPSSNAFFGMAPTTLHHLPHNRDISYQKLLRLSSALPAYKWQLGFDISKFQSSFTNFMNNELS
jgi:hypothetical protein